MRSWHSYGLKKQKQERTADNGHNPLRVREELMRKAFSLGVILALGFTFCSSGEQAGQEVAESQPQVSEDSFQYYVASQAALAVDNYDEAGSALEKLAAEATGDLKALAERAAQAEDIQSMRNAFIALSDQMAALDLPEGYVVAFCPMANNSMGANWVQKDGAIMNPYFGTSMQDCGSIVR